MSLVMEISLPSLLKVPNGLNMSVLHLVNQMDHQFVSVVVVQITFMRSLHPMWSRKSCFICSGIPQIMRDGVEQEVDIALMPSKNDITHTEITTNADDEEIHVVGTTGNSISSAAIALGTMEALQTQLLNPDST